MWVLIEAMVVTFVCRGDIKRPVYLEGTVKYFLLQTFRGLLILRGVSCLSEVSWALAGMGLAVKLGLFPGRVWVVPLLSAQPISSLWLMSVPIKVPGVLLLSHFGWC